MRLSFVWIPLAKRIWKIQERCQYSGIRAQLVADTTFLKTRSSIRWQKYINVAGNYYMQKNNLFSLYFYSRPINNKKKFLFIFNLDIYIKQIFL